MLTVFNPACNARVNIRREGPGAISVRDTRMMIDDLESKREKGARQEKSSQVLYGVVVSFLGQDTSNSRSSSKGVLIQGLAEHTTVTFKIRIRGVPWIRNKKPLSSPVCPTHSNDGGV